MNEDTYYRCNPHKALYGMRNLNPEQRGAYRTLIDLYYVAGGPLEDNEKYLAGQNGCSVRKWRALRDQLLALGRIRIDERGLIREDGCDQELAQRVEEARRAEESGRAGGKKSAAKRAARLQFDADSASAQPRPNADSTLSQRRELNESDAEALENKEVVQGCLNQEAKPNEDKVVVVDTRDARDGDQIKIWFAALIAAAGPGLADPAKAGTLHTTAGELAAWSRAGVDLEADAVPVVRGKTAAPRDRPFFTWQIFTPEVMAAKARREQALQTPEIDDARIGEGAFPQNRTRNGGYATRRGSGSSGLVGAALRAQARRQGVEQRDDSTPESVPRLALAAG